MMRKTAKGDPHARLLRALLEMAGERSGIDDSSSRAWASATFMGARHKATLRLSGPDAHERAHALADSLPEVEFAISGHVVADVAVEEQALFCDDEGQAVALLEIGVLTVEDW